MFRALGYYESFCLKGSLYALSGAISFKYYMWCLIYLLVLIHSVLCL